MTFRFLKLTILPGLAAVALTGCGSSGSSDNGVSSQSADQILTSTKTAVQQAKSVHVSGSLASGGQTISLDLDILSGKGGSGHMSEGGLSFQLVAINNTVYIKGSPAFWQHFGGTAAAQLFQGKWLKAPATGDFASFAQLTNLPQLFSKITSSNTKLAKGGTTTVNGQKVVAVNNTAQGGTLYVATTGQPYPVQITESGSNGGKLTFDRWNESVSLSAPANAIDVSQFSKG